MSQTLDVTNQTKTITYVHMILLMQWEYLSVDLNT